MTLALALLLFQSATPQPPIADEPLTLPAIVYPADAKAARMQGVVHLEIKVDPAGHVTSVRAIDGPEGLRQAAIDAYTHATYRPLMKDNRPAPAVITTAVNFTLTEAPPDNDMQVNAKFQPLHMRCQQLSAAHDAEALDTCRQALAMSQRFSPGAQLEARVTTVNDLVLLLIAGGKRSPNLAEAGTLADQAVLLVQDGVQNRDPHKPAVALAYITRAEVRSLANDLAGAASDCAVAEEVLTNLLDDQGKKTANSVEDTETERASSYRLQLHETLLLHAVVLDRQHKAREAKAMRTRAEHT
jgi:TonB family protein